MFHRWQSASTIATSASASPEILQPSRQATQLGHPANSLFYPNGIYKKYNLTLNSKLMGTITEIKNTDSNN